MESMQAILWRRVLTRLREQMSGVYSPGVQCRATNIPYAHATAKFSFTSAPERAEALQRALMAVIDTFVTQGVTAHELQTVRAMLRRRREVSMQRDAYWVTLLSDGALHGHSLTELAAREAHVADITPEMINDVARRLLDPSRYVSVRQVPVRLAPMQRDAFISAQQW
jgi:zinc protease